MLFLEFTVHGEVTQQHHRRVVGIQDLPKGATTTEVILSSNNKWHVGHTAWSCLPKRLLQPSVTATFDIFIETLQPWERDLFCHHILHADPYTIRLDTQVELRVVSDGSAHPPYVASFGWMSSTHHGERAAEGMGLVRGRLLYSYRAEAARMLSALRFLIRIKEFT
jgi:hypothetical protein